MSELRSDAALAPLRERVCEGARARAREHPPRAIRRLFGVHLAKRHPPQHRKIQNKAIPFASKRLFSPLRVSYRPSKKKAVRTPYFAFCLNKQVVEFHRPLGGEVFCPVPECVAQIRNTIIIPHAFPPI